jgi:hypothetical protein
MSSRFFSLFHCSHSRQIFINVQPSRQRYVSKLCKVQNLTDIFNLQSFYLDQISDLCERSPNFLTTYRSIEGALITSRNEKNVDCTIKFQTNSILQRFMLRFESLNLDCNDKRKNAITFNQKYQHFA